MMKPQGRVGDTSFCPADGHGCPACPHPVTGPATQGSSTVIINNQPALRVGDRGSHAACCGSNTWTAAQGSGSVLIDGKPAFRQSDMSQHCGGSGKLMQGSTDVLVGD